MRKTDPLLNGVIDKSQPLERTLKLRELQTSYVYTTVLAKKCRVCTTPALSWAGLMSRSKMTKGTAACMHFSLIELPRAG